MEDSFESFSESEEEILNHFVSNTHANIFALRNLPEVIKGALFSRYSRSYLGLRSLLLKEFISCVETDFNAIVKSSFNESVSEQALAIKKAQNFYDRILDGYGDDSIGELGGAHLAIENISMLAAKAIEDCRIGGSPIEKSTRYVHFDQKENDEYLYVREPMLMTSSFKNLYVETCDRLFETYSQLIPPVTEMIQETFERAPGISDGAYRAALRAKVLDTLRGLLPASTKTNMGLFANGRFFETMIQKLRSSTLTEIVDIAQLSFEELGKVIPSFIRRSEENHRHRESYQAYMDGLQEKIAAATRKLPPSAKAYEGSYVKLVDFDATSVEKVIAALLFPEGDHSLEELSSFVDGMSEEERDEVLQAGCFKRQNRRHKSPRALEHATFTFEIQADFGVYRDLQRHRILTQNRQYLTMDYGYFIPEEILGTPHEKLYRKAMEQAKQAYETIREEFPVEAQYVVPMAANVRWYFHVNLRALQWLTELRSSPQGHPQYRLIAQEMAKQVSSQFPEFEKFFRFVDFDGYTLGRLDQEIRTEQRQKERV